jgi:hypothetical protein
MIIEYPAKINASDSSIQSQKYHVSNNHAGTLFAEKEARDVQ